MSFMGYLAKKATQSEVQCREVELSLLEKTPGAKLRKLLDLGCGDGSFTIKCADVLVIPDKNVYGIDAVPENVAKAKQRGIDARCYNLNSRIEFPDNQFDVVVASHIIEHLNNTDLFLQEIYRVLKPGGYLVIATPNLASFQSILYLMCGKQPSIAEVSDRILVNTWSPRGKDIDRTGFAHRRIFTKGALVEMLEYYGFRVERVIMTGLCRGRYASNIVVKARKPTC